MKKILLLIIFGILSGAGIAMSWIAPFYLVWSIVFTIVLAISYILLLGTQILNHKWKNLSLTISIIAICVVALFVIFYYTGLLSHFSSLEEARAWFESFGAWTWIIFFLIQVAQVVILPIPSQITTIAGVLIFGAWKTFVISAVAIVLASYLCFGIGRWVGVKVAYKIASKETVDKYRNLLTKKGRLLLPIMFLFPAFPDDLLCFIAGTTKMTWRYFIIITLLTRLVGIACICWLGSGDLIPFSGWGIPVWIVIGILMAIAIFILIKYQEQIEDWIIATFTKDGKEKIAQKRKKQKQQQLDQEIVASQDDKRSYINFEDATKTKDGYVNFESQEKSNGILFAPESQKDEAKSNKDSIAKNSRTKK